MMRIAICLASTALLLAGAAGAQTAPAAKATTAAKTVKTTTTATPAAKPAKPKAATTGRMVTTKTSTGKTITYNCSLPGNASKKACK